VRRHLAASGAVLAADVRRWDSVRIGLATYGLVPDALAPAPEVAPDAARLRPVMALCARPVRVVDLPSGHGVSYGPSFVTARASRIATLPLGYADGWRRALSDRAWALVRGTRVPLVGRVAMDAVMADVTDVAGKPVTERDEFVLLGEQGGQRISAFELASACETISYEVVAAMSRRLPRVYHAAGSPVEIRVLAGGRSEWHASSSGTATSATSRSTRS
jgi:alanine racemase